MRNKFENYADKVVRLVGCNKATGKKIKEDIYNTLMEKQTESGISDPYELMGVAEEVAKEFRENLNELDEVSELGTDDYGKCRYRNSYIRIYDYEYKSKTKLFGLPLVHIVGGIGGRPRLAKGIIAIGPAAVGVVALGAVSMGVLSLGGISLALLLALGGVSISAYAALGGVAISYVISFGGLAIAKHIAVGGMAIADIAIGGYAKGVIAVCQDNGSAQYLFREPVNYKEVMDTINKVYPDLKGFKLSVLKTILGFMKLV